jgi:N-acetylglucosamine-6-phosphate deacetylase
MARNAHPNVVTGRLVLADRVASGRLTIEDGRIVTIDLVQGDEEDAGPFIAPGFIDLHVHGFGGHDAMAGVHALDGMSRALLRRGVTAFLPTAVSAGFPELAAFASSVRDWAPAAPDDGAAALGHNLEGPFLAPSRAGAQTPNALRVPAETDWTAIEPLLDGLRLITIAPELPGSLELITRSHGLGVVVSLGHSAAGIGAARAGYAAGARSTTHLFNAMSGLDHRSPGLAAAALTDDAVAVELVADGEHVHPALWELIVRAKPAGRLILVSDAIAPAGVGDGRTRLGGLDVVVKDGRATLAGTETLAGSVIALDDAVRNLVFAGIGLPLAVAAASANPADLLGLPDRGRLAVGQTADLVELDEDLRVRRVMRAGSWIVSPAA